MDEKACAGIKKGQDKFGMTKPGIGLNECGREPNLN
jgi:hypothetical protein